MISKNYFIRGVPKSGKTTIIKEIIKTFPSKFQGFYTNEIREENRRVGFDLINIRNSYSVQFARIGTAKPKIGKYSVFISKFEQFLEKNYQFEKLDAKKIIIIDEIGKMELLSNKFISWLKKICQSRFIIATLPVQQIELIDEILNSYKKVIYSLDILNRSLVKEKILGNLKKDFICELDH